MGKLNFKIHWSFVVFGFLLIFFGKGTMFLAYIIGVVLHELGHALVGKKLGYKLNTILIMPYGASLSGNNVALKNRDEILIAMAGPLVNIFLIILGMAIWWIFPSTYCYTNEFVFANVSTLTFNLIPVYPLDGGRVLYSILSLKLKRKTAFKICKIIGIILTLFFFIMFVVSAFYEINYSMGLNSLFLLLCLFEDEKSAYYINVKTFDKGQEFKSGVFVKTFAIDKEATLYSTYKMLDKTAVNEIYVVDNSLSIKYKMMESELENLIFSMPLDTKICDALKLKKGLVL